MCRGIFAAQPRRGWRDHSPLRGTKGAMTARMAVACGLRLNLAPEDEVLVGANHCHGTQCCYIALARLVRLNPVISCRAVRRDFGDFTAIQDLSFEVAPGAICSLLGPNGAGKSTTIKVLTGLLPLSGGTAQVAGYDVKDGLREMKGCIGVVPDDLGLFDDLTVAEHLSLTGAVHRLEARTARHRTDQLMSVLDLKRFGGRFVSACSHGVRKKTALAMALLPNPRVLFLDEPFEGVDPVTSRTICELLRQAAERETTVLLTTHSLFLAQSIASQFVIMVDGQLVWNVSAKDVSGPLEQHYMDLVEPIEAGEVDWLGWRQS